jgi:hypothetical protein
LCAIGERRVGKLGGGRAAFVGDVLEGSASERPGMAELVRARATEFMVRIRLA